MKRSKDAFFSPSTMKSPPTIFYNDYISSYARQRYSIFHEVKHYVNNDLVDDIYNDNMADYFSHYFMCPIPYCIITGVEDEHTLVSKHLISKEAAQNILRNVKNRQARYGSKIFDYEKPLIQILTL